MPAGRPDPAPELASPAQAEFERILNEGPQALIWCSLPDWRVRLASRRFVTTFGYEAESLSSLAHWFELAFPDPEYRHMQTETWRQALKAFESQGVPLPDLEVKVRAKAGNIVHCVLSTAIVGTHALVNLSDVTVMRLALERLDESENRYQQLFANMTSGFALHELILDGHGKPFDYRFIEVNPAFEKLTKIPAAVVVGHTVRQLMPNTEQYWIDTYGHVALTGEPTSFMNYDKEIGRWFDTCTIRPRPGQFAVVMNDVTDRVHAENALRDLNADLEQRISQRTHELELSNRQLLQAEKLVGLGTLVAGVAHEINTPIGVAQTAASFLQDLSQGKTLNGELKEQKLREGLDIILRNLTRAAEIIRAFKQLSVDQSSSHSRNFLLRELCQDVVTSLSPRIRRMNVNVVMDLPADINLYGPGGELSQVLTNLVMNALEHGFTGRMSEAEIRISAAMRRDQLEIVVANNGNPIPAEIRSRIFDPFFTTRRGEGGTGLGLSIIHNIITEHCRGSIDFESGEGQGVSFRISLPVGPKEVFRSFTP